MEKNARIGITQRLLAAPPVKRLWAGGLFLIPLIFWAVPYPETLPETYRALRADPVGYYTLKKLRWKAYLEQSFNLVDAPTLTLTIKPGAMEKLRQKRDEALRAKYLIQGDDDFVPAVLSLDGQTLDVRLRLKGDMPDHFSHIQKWSYRIHTKGEDQLFGMRRFSLQDPITRYFQHENMFFETMRLFDILTPRYFYVNVIQNGQHLGLMAVEEHFSRELLERQGRRESVIVRFDESQYWQAASAIMDEWDNYLLYDNYLLTTIDAFQMSKIQKSPQLSQDRVIAIGLLRGFVEGRLPASQVFDVERMASYVACAQFWSAWHPLVWTNLRFYYNPLTMRLEPVAYDGSIKFEHAMYTVAAPVIRRMLDDTAFFTAYLKTWRALISMVKDGSLIARFQEIERAQLSLLLMESRFVRPFDFRNLMWRVDDFEKLLKTPSALLDTTTVRPDTRMPQPLNTVQYPRLIQTYLIHEDTSTPRLELINILPFPVLIHAIQWEDEAGNTEPWQPDVPITLPLTLEPCPFGGRPISFHIPYKRPSLINGTLRVEAGLAGDTPFKTHTALSYVPALTAQPRPSSNLETQLKAHAFLRLDRSDSTLRIPPGRWDVRTPLIVPEGYRLNISAGAVLQFSPTIPLVAYGPVFCEGTEAQPIILDGAPAHGDTLWPGVIVLQAERRSIWSHVIVRHTSGLESIGWTLTGGVTFYRSDVTMERCLFEKNRAEDALNVVHADVLLRGARIVDTASDGLDTDFATGRVEGGLFENIGHSGGDAIDVSGSDMTIQDTVFRNVSDKSLSAGEKSTMRVTGIRIENTIAGVVSKDNSQVHIRDSSIDRAHLAALMAYIKKPEYGPARLTGEGLEIRRSLSDARVQIGSRMEVNGKGIKEETLDVDLLYRTIMKKPEVL